LRALENQWHQIFIAWQSNLGQIKVQLQQEKNRRHSFWRFLFGG